MTKEEFCDCLKTAEEGFKLTWNNGETYEYNGKDHFVCISHPVFTSHSLSYVLENTKDFKIFQIPRKKSWIMRYSKFDLDRVFLHNSYGHCMSVLNESSTTCAPGSIRLKITIEEVFE